MDYKKDYYKILEIPLTASKEEVRAAYRRLAKLYHPDKNAGNTEAEEKFKQINEANEVLSNPILRQEYDAYRSEQERWRKDKAQQEPGKEEVIPKNKRSYTRTKTVVTETRIYIRGEIKVKYWASGEERMAASFDTELDYKINPTEAIIAIREEDVFPMQEIPLDYLKAVKESDIFSMPIPQPIRCEVTGKNGKEHFELTLNDIRIKNIKLDGVTKHDNYSYGTLTGQVYGYSPKFTSEEIEETVTECFGETGNTERKEENGFTYTRKEYYHSDCTTYWGEWIQLPGARQAERAYNWGYTKKGTAWQGGYSYRRKRDRVHANASSPDPGWGLLALVALLLPMMFLFPNVFIFFLLALGIGLLRANLDIVRPVAGRVLSIVVGGLLLLLVITAARSFSTPQPGYIRKKENTASISTSRRIRKSGNSGDSTNAAPDTLITHFLKWKDYDGRPYQGTLSISTAAFRNAEAGHRRMSGNYYPDMSEIYRAMLDQNASGLPYAYETFDSIRAANKLDEVAFSQVLVSAIQSLPYFLVLDKDCESDFSDDFIRNYLANCKTDCCIGYELFGVRSPIEFLSDLKGDCDTRSLLLYEMLKHYNYDVALLTSDYYKHAMIAVHFDSSKSQQGLSIMVGNKRYYMWETTSPDLNYGLVSSNFNNLDHWNISLLNKKIQ